ncbi:MAG: tRNA adenosine(34) deaminase TadA [Deltaproteobacteria bacterium]|nr:tRNA adenosine(34) deaminase TadA [Candidatus Zymogenaceae bacterium]
MGLREPSVHTGPHSPEVFMGCALDLARDAYKSNEVPVGAVVVRDDRIIGRGKNEMIARSDPTAHAEILALRDAAERIGNYRLEGADLYVTMEPCVMCAGAILHSRIRRLFYGAPDPKAGAVDSLFKLLGDMRLNHRVEVTAGIGEDEAREMITRFFIEKR